MGLGLYVYALSQPDVMAMVYPSPRTFAVYLAFLAPPLGGLALLVVCLPIFMLARLRDWCAQEGSKPERASTIALHM